MKLIIFDLDQTLVDFLSVHDEVTRRVFKRFFNVDARLTEIDFAGKSLTENFSELARLKDIPEDIFRKKSNQLLESYETTFDESLPNDATKYVLPGAKRLLSELSKTNHIVALYTGDSSKIVNHVFRATGLGRYFRFCFYGTEVESRSDMVKLAINKAEKSTGREFRDKNIVIIGDSVRDIECGKSFNALTIAVATGFHSEEELLKAKPDYLFDSLKEYRKVLKAIG
jgi:phosphoglycolate phosphatase